ncbi:MAG TPA: branched-chain amino acid ABC transporter permease, partial [Pseudodesulfovibrio sp.]|nr:branched-chain amino acid ABC transporter permease [Pseudodesulfovibrio sp.]
MDFFLQQLINGITLGSVYALIALGYTMVYGIIQLINFAHGEFFAAGGYMGVILISYLSAQGLHPYACLGISLVLAMGYCALLAMAVEQLAYKPLRQASRLAALLSALGMSIFLQNGLMLTQGVYDKPYPTEITSGGFEVGAISVSYMQIFIVALTAFLLVGLNLLVFKTRIGRAMRATAQDKVMSALVGINSNRIIALTFAVGAGLAAAAGIMVGLYYGSVNYTMGFVPGIKAFAA